MKRVLITGANSYIGTSFEKYIKTNYPETFSVDTIDMIDGSWRDYDFSGYDCVFHVAGIAHKKETKQNKELYYDVNCTLAAETAKKAKNSGVKHFVYLSSMSVFGLETGVISRDTQPMPKSNYGISKLNAELELSKLVDGDFIISTLRPPMVYGYGCKGNFQKIVKLVNKLPFFPYVNNQRSMIYIDNLCEFVRLIIESKCDGVFHPQNQKYVKTTDMAKLIAKGLNRKLVISRVLGIFVMMFYPFFAVIKKSFGSLVYQDMECEGFNYQVCDFESSVIRSVKGDNDEHNSSASI